MTVRAWGYRQETGFWFEIERPSVTVHVGSLTDNDVEELLRVVTLMKEQINGAG